MLELHMEFFPPNSPAGTIPSACVPQPFKAIFKGAGIPLIGQQGTMSAWLDVKGLNFMSGFCFFLVLSTRSQWAVWLTRTGADRCCHAPRQKPSCSEKIHLKPNEQYNVNGLMNPRELWWQWLSLAPCQWSVLTRDTQALFWQNCAEAHQKSQSERNHSPLSCRQMDLKVQVSSYLIRFSKVHRTFIWKHRTYHLLCLT